MSKYMINSMLNEISNVAVLSVKQYDDLNDILYPTYETRARFLQAAGVLDKEQFLGLQIKKEEGGKRQACVFSSADAGVNVEDLKWMFQEYADMDFFSETASVIRHDDSNKIYELCRAPGNSGQQHGSCEDEMSNNGEAFSSDYFLQLLDEMEKSDAAIQIIAGVTHDGRAAGAIILILPDEMSLKMRTMVSLAFPHTIVRRMDEFDEDSADNGITMRYLRDSMTIVLDKLMRERYEEEADKKAHDGSDEGFPKSGCGSERFTPIDELELSVRSYNCLKRAGINSVEELMHMSDEDYFNIRNMSWKCVDEIKQRLSELQTLTAAPQVTAGNYTDMLDELIGLKEVKDQVRKITAFVKMRQDMKELGMVEAPAAFNMEFVGNPGTAKTTVARILAGIFHEIGLLSSYELVEVGRADLVGQYVGHTADRVKSVFRRAKGKLLFIDEAYSLVDYKERSFGDEAINTIVQEMENNRNDTVVIFAGYPDKMKEFFSRNPGLRSRVPFHIRFSDYSAEEMVRIVELEAGKRGFSFGDNVRELISSICEKALRNPDAGNGRFCRNLVENAILGYALRVYGADYEGNANKDFQLQEEDFVFPENMQEMKGSVPIGFRVS